MAEVQVHERALCESDAVGDGTCVSAFAHIHAGAQVGRDCVIRGGVIIGGGAVIGDRVTIESGVQVWAGVRLEDNVSVGPNAAFTQAVAPRSAADADHLAPIVIHRGASIGANATILPGVEVGREAVVGAGSVVARSVPPHAVVSGNPAVIQAYLETEPRDGDVAAAPLTVGRVRVPVRGVHVQRFPEFSDFRGSLTAGDLPSDAIPFTPRRWFLVYDVPSRELRGEHAHRVCHQFLICVTGSVSVAVDDGKRRSEVVLDRPNLGIYVPPLVWASQFRHEHDSVLLVIASHPYDPADYVRDYETFMAEVRPSRDGGQRGLG